jgi:hypothetical protein
MASFAPSVQLLFQSAAASAGAAFMEGSAAVTKQPPQQQLPQQAQPARHGRADKQAFRRAAQRA